MLASKANHEAAMVEIALSYKMHHTLHHTSNFYIAKNKKIATLSLQDRVQEAKIISIQNTGKYCE